MGLTTSFFFVEAADMSPGCCVRCTSLPNHGLCFLPGAAFDGPEGEWQSGSSSFLVSVSSLALFMVFLLLLEQTS